MANWTDTLLIFFLYINNFILFAGNNTIFLLDFSPLLIGLLLHREIDFIRILGVLLSIIFINSLFFHSLLFFPLYFTVIILSYLVIHTVSIYNPNYKYLFFFGIVFSALLFKILFMGIFNNIDLYRSWNFIGLNVVFNIIIIWRLKDDKFKFVD